MATQSIQGLFGGMGTPEEMQRQLVEQKATQFAGMSPQQQTSYNIYKNTSNLGRGLAGAFGVDVQDPAIKRATMLRQMASQFDTNTVEGLKQMAQALQGTDPELGYQVMQRAQAMEKSGADIETSKIDLEKKKNAVTQEKKFREELDALPADATQEDIIRLAGKYGGADRILQVAQQSLDKKAANDAKIEATKAANEAKIEAAKVAAQAKVDAAVASGESKETVARIAAEGRSDTARLVASLKGPKPLAPSLQKSEDDDLTKVDAALAQAEALLPVINSLTPNEKGMRALDLNPKKIAGYIYQNSIGKSSPESLAYSRLKEAVATAVNIKTSAEKGVQTDKDVLRFADALISASAKFDSQGTLDALKRFNEAVLKDQERIKKRINSRRISQGVDVYYPEIVEGKQAPKQAGTGTPDVATLRSEANAAIAKGANPAAVKARFKQLTNQEF